MNFDELIQLQALKLKASLTGRIPLSAEPLVETLPESVVRQMCAKVSIQLYDRLERVTDALRMSKREFIEAAVAEAVLRAEELIDRVIPENQKQKEL